MFDDLLVPTDGSECAETAVGYAADLATRYGATVHALSVVDSRILDNAPDYDERRRERTELAERTGSELADGGVGAESAVRTDVPHRAILSYATDNGIDLIVMGTHGRTGVERYLLGSVTETVVRLSDVPVLTVTTTDDGGTYPYDDVLVPTDGSEGAAAAIGPAVSVAETYDADLHALSVVDSTAMGVDVRSAVATEQLEEAARAAVDAVADRAGEASIAHVETAVEYGSAYREIRSYVRDHGVDLVVMGTHGRSGIERYLLGSVAEKTVRTAPVPVMTVRGAETSQ